MKRKKIYLGNDWLIRRTGVASQPTGALVTGVTIHGHLAATPDGAPIHASTQVSPLTELAPGDFIGTIEGTALTDHVKVLWDAAELAGTILVIYERVIVDDEDYADVVELQVERDRPASVPLPVVL